MNSSVGSYDAKTHLPRLLNRVKKGERIIITRHGVPIAQLVPMEQSDVRDRHAAIAELKRFSRGRSLGGLTIREMIEEGRKY